MPYVEDEPDGPHWATKSGINMGLLAGLSPEVIHKIICGNAAKFYGLVN